MTSSRVTSPASLLPPRALAETSLKPIRVLVISPSERLDDIAARHLTSLPLSTAEHMTSVSFEDEMTLLAVVGDWGSERVVGTVSYYRDPTTGHADVAFMVDPEWKGRGLGSALRDVVIDVARRRGVVALTADVLVENAAMLSVFRGSGLPMTARSSHGVTEIVMPL